MMVRQRVGFTFKTSLSSRRGFLIKFLPNFPRLVMIGFLTQSLKKEGVLVHLQGSQLVGSVSRNIMVVAFRERIIVLVVVKVGTKFEIAQM